MFDNFMPENRMRRCMVCQGPIEDMRKASGVPTGAGTVLVLHDSCAKALNDEINARNTHARDLNAPQRQYEGLAGSPEPTQVINKPCIVCHKQVTTGTTMKMGEYEYAAHPGCKQQALDLIGQVVSLDYDLHPESQVRRIDNARPVL